VFAYLVFYANFQQQQLVQMSSGGGLTLFLNYLSWF